MRGGSVVSCLSCLLVAACFTDGGASTGASGASGLTTAPTSAATTSTGEDSTSATGDATTTAATTTAEASASASTTDATTSTTSTSDATSTTSDPTSTGEASTTSTTGGAPCESADDCGADQFCDFPDVLCGAGSPGSCAPRPAECNDKETLTFGCDCLEYASPCAAQMAGTDVRGNILDCD